MAEADYSETKYVSSEESLVSGLTVPAARLRRRGAARLLQVALHLRHRAHGSIVGTLAEIAPGAALP